METKIKLHFSNNKPTQKINCKKIILKKIQIVNGDFKHLKIGLWWSLGKGYYSNYNISIRGLVDMYKFIINGVYEFKTEFPNGWYNLADAIGNLEITMSCINTHTINKKEYDFDVILFADIIKN